MSMVGCYAKTDVYTVSEPSAPGARVVQQRKYRGQHSIFEANGVQFTVTPMNARFLSGETFTLLVRSEKEKPTFPTKHAVRYLKEAAVASPPFTVEIGLLATVEGVAIDLARLPISAPGGRAISPAGVIPKPREKCAGLGAFRMLTSCDPGRSESPQEVGVLPLAPQAVQYLWLVYDIPPPPPEASYFLRLAGVTIHGELQPEVTVVFSAMRTSLADSAP